MSTPNNNNNNNNTKDSNTNNSSEMLTTKTPDMETEDGRISNREAATKIRDAWIYKQIRARQDEFTNYRTVC